MGSMTEDYMRRSMVMFLGLGVALGCGDGSGGTGSFDPRFALAGSIGEPGIAGGPSPVWGGATGESGVAGSPPLLEGGATGEPGVAGSGGATGEFGVAGSGGSWPLPEGGSAGGITAGSGSGGSSPGPWPCDPAGFEACVHDRDVVCAEDPRGDVCLERLIDCDELRLACEPAQCDVSVPLCYERAIDQCSATPDPLLCSALFNGCDRLAQACASR